jgi:hypothetical protein
LKFRSEAHDSGLEVAGWARPGGVVALLSALSGES